MKKLPEPPNWVTQYNLEGESLRLKNSRKLSYPIVKYQVIRVQKRFEGHNDMTEKCFEVVGDSEGGYDTIEAARIAKKSCEAFYPSIDKFIIIQFYD